MSNFGDFKRLQTSAKHDINMAKKKKIPQTQQWHGSSANSCIISFDANEKHFYSVRIFFFFFLFFNEFPKITEWSGSTNEILKMSNNKAFADTILMHGTRRDILSFPMNYLRPSFHRRFLFVLWLSIPLHCNSQPQN
jgi:hypothetical protein